MIYETDVYRAVAFRREKPSHQPPVLQALATVSARFCHFVQWECLNGVDYEQNTSSVVATRPGHSLLRNDWLFSSLCKG
jgi:hypothetical protein